MDSERFDGLVRGFEQARSRRQTLRGLAGAGALLALLAATPVAAGKAGKPNAPKNAGKNPGNSQPGTGQNGPLGSGPSGQPGPSPTCARCEEAYEGCVEPCGGESTCLTRCQTKLDSCNAQCPNP